MAVPTPSESPLPPPPTSPKHDGLVQLGRLAKVPVILVAAATALSAVDVLLEIYLLSKFDRSDTVFNISERTDDIYVLTGWLMLLHLLLFISAGVSVFLLLRRVLNNGAQMVPQEVKHKTHWAITGWFVPFLNLIRPYDMVKQAWVTNRSTSPGSRHEDPPDSFKLWWGLWIVMIIVERVASRFSPAVITTMDQLANEALATLIVQTLTTCTGVAFIYVLRALINRAQLAIESPWTNEPDGARPAVPPHNRAPISWSQPLQVRSDTSFERDS